MLIRDVSLRADCLFDPPCQRAINLTATIAVGGLWFIDIERLEKLMPVGHDQRPTLEKNNVPSVQEKV